MGGRGSISPKGGNTVQRTMTIIGPMQSQQGNQQRNQSPLSSAGYEQAFGGAHMFMTAEFDAKNSNPNFGTGDRKWRQNCQRCVFAYEMRRRGYDVEALPRKFGSGETLPYMNDAKGWPKVMKGAQLIDFGSYGVQGKMEAQMASWGDGARAVVRVKWKGRNSGHVFIAEQIGGRTVYIDPQSGKYDFNVNDYLSQAVKKGTRLMRIDDLEPSDLILDCAKKAG